MSNAETTSSRSLVVPLPATPAEWVLKSGLKRTINDEVQTIHERLISSTRLGDAYRVSLEPTSDEESPEGWVAADDYVACTMIKEYAVAEGHGRVARLQLGAIRAALNVVLRRYGMSRKQRRFMIDGKEVPAPGGEE